MKKLLLLFTLLPLFTWAQHTISGTFAPASEFKAAILYKLETSNTVYVNNATITNGEFKIELDATVKPGMYRIVYALPQDQFNFDFIYNKEDIVFTFNRDKGVSFQVSEENKLLAAYRENMVDIKTRINTYYAETTQNQSDYLKLISELESTQTKYETASKGMLANHFISAEKPYVPTAFEEAPTYFNNYKTNYFKPIDFSDPVLKNSNFLIDAALKYIFVFVDKSHPNRSYKNNIDDVVLAIGQENDIKKTVLEVLWEQFKNQQNEDVANYISTTYLIALLNPETDKDLLQEIKAFKNTAIGVVAPDFSWPSKQGSNALSKLHGKEFYIVTFWSSTCSHCLKELPVLKRYLNDKNNIRVLAIGLEDERGHWEQTIKNYPDFTQIYGEGHWDNPISTTYGVTETPSFFILDSDKKIVAKPDDVEELITFLDLQK